MGTRENQQAAAEILRQLDRVRQGLVETGAMDSLVPLTDEMRKLVTDYRLVGLSEFQIGALLMRNMIEKADPPATIQDAHRRAVMLAVLIDLFTPAGQ